MSSNVLTIPCCDIISSGLRDPGSVSVGSASPGASIARVHFTVQSATGSLREQGPEADNTEREAVIRGDITEARGQTCDTQ